MLQTGADEKHVRHGTLFLAPSLLSARKSFETKNFFVFLFYPREILCQEVQFQIRHRLFSSVQRRSPCRLLGARPSLHGRVQAWTGPGGRLRTGGVGCRGRGGVRMAKRQARLHRRNCRQVRVFDQKRTFDFNKICLIPQKSSRWHLAFPTAPTATSCLPFRVCLRLTGSRTPGASSAASRSSPRRSTSAGRH
jgi:hypothetical protein